LEDFVGVSSFSNVINVVGGAFELLVDPGDDGGDVTETVE
jgi:hypothetical protein